MKILRILLLLSLVPCFLSGCQTGPRVATLWEEVRRDPNLYIVEAVIIDTSRAGKNLLYADFVANLNTVLQLSDTQASCFEAARLAPGKTEELSKKEWRRYPVEFDRDGHPSKFERRSIGWLIRVGPLSVQGKRAKLSLLLHDSVLVGMNEMKTPAGETYEKPCCTVRRIKTDVDVPIDAWEVLKGGLIATEQYARAARGQFERQSVRFYRIVAIRVRSPISKLRAK